MVVALIGLLVVLVVVAAFVTQWAWNTFMPGIFNLPSIDLLQAFALNIMIMIVRGAIPSTTKKD